MKKIKSVKLKNDYRTFDYHLPKGTELTYSGIRWWLSSNNSLSESEIETNKTDLFEIEYEEERKYIDVRIEYESDNAPLTADRVKAALELKYDVTFRNFKVKELSEQWTDADLIDYNNFCDDNGYSRDAWSIERFKAERSKA